MISKNIPLRSSFPVCRQAGLRFLYFLLPVSHRKLLSSGKRISDNLRIVFEVFQVHAMG